MATTDLVFYGAGGHAKVVLECWLNGGGGVAAIFDDNPARRELLGRQVSGKYDPSMHPRNPIIISIGDNRIRMKLSSSIRHSFAIVRHSSAQVSPSATIGDGTVLLPGSVIAASSVIGKHVIINHNSTVDHDCRIGDFVHIAPGATICGEVIIGNGSTIGAGSTLLPGISVGKWATIGAGSVITKPVPDYAVVAGVPGKVLRYNQA